MSDAATVVDAPPADRPGWRQRAVKALDAYDGPKLDDPDVQTKMEWLADQLAGSEGIIPDRYLGAPKTVVAGIMQASRLNIPVMTALCDLYYEDGGMAMKAGLIQLLVRRGGHAILIHRSDASAAVIEIQRSDGRPGGTVEWTIGEATVAGLVVNQTWQDYPADCLFARAIARAARRHAADATGGTVYVPEEVQSGYADGGDADAALQVRVVSEPVQNLLDGLDAADHATVRQRWITANDRRLLNAYAGEGMTLGLVLREALEQTMPKPRPAPPISGAGAGAAAAVMSCGCPVAVVIETGDHLPDCAQRAALPQVEPVPEVLPAAPARARQQKARGKGKKRGGRRRARR